MPIRIPAALPAYEALKAENVFAMTEERARAQDIRPLKIAIANLMPTTLATEIQLLRLLGNSPIQVDITLLRMGSHEAKNAPSGHLDRFYTTLDAVMHERFDGLIVTGAPVETLPFEEVDYWPELTALLDYARDNVFSSLHICWGAQAGLYRRYGVGKRPLAAKLSGVFAHSVNERSIPLFRGFDDVFYAPQSRYTEVDPKQVAARPELTVESSSAEAGLFIVSARGGRELYVSGHLEYDPGTLDGEYRRDLAKGIPIAPPRNYYPYDDPAQPPQVRWRAHAHLFFSNWLNYYVYQETPYRLEEL
jgi:homoserine O-succinyltransferase